MSTKEKEMWSRKAVRYIENASDILRTKVNKKDRYYQGEKNVRMACATAYNAVLLSTEAFLEMKSNPIQKKKHSRLNVDHFRKGLAKVANKILDEFNTAYRVLHLEGYYEGERNYVVIQAGITAAIQIINKIKPMGLDSFKLN